MFTDQVSPLAHMHARDVSFALVSTAPQPKIQAFKQRMGWEVPWYTVVGDEFQTARGTTEYFSLDVYLRDGDRVFLTYATRSRGVEALGSVWTFLDLTPLGRQEEWEDTPPGRPAETEVRVVAAARRVRAEPRRRRPDDPRPPRRASRSRSCWRLRRPRARSGSRCAPAASS